jgi:hypothetical protein
MPGAFAPGIRALSVAFSSDGQRIVAANADRMLLGLGEVSVWDGGSAPPQP